MPRSRRVRRRRQRVREVLVLPWLLHVRLQRAVPWLSRDMLRQGGVHQQRGLPLLPWVWQTRLLRDVSYWRHKHNNL